MILDSLFIFLISSVLIIFSFTLLKDKSLKTSLSWGVAFTSSLVTAISLSVNATSLLKIIKIKSNFGNWFTIANTSIEITFFVDPWSLIISLLSSWLTLMIIIFSWTYIGKTKHAPLYYGLVNLFLFGMLLLLLSDNLVLLFFGWEIVGICSWGLISFYYFKEEIGEFAIKSGLKALIVTGFADLGLIFGIFLLISNNYSLIISDLVNLDYLPNYIIYGFILAAAGKSAQFPLHIWISSSDNRNIDAMQGPTTVSALIHAATMVNAGIYLASRFFMIPHSANINNIIILIGSFTALYASISAMGTYDMKRILAYSTISQLGYMMVAIGIKNYGSFISLWHLINHALFKGLLFLTIGAILYSHHNRDLRNITFDIRENKIIYFSLLIGLASLVGVPPFSGFFSKDVIIEYLIKDNHTIAAVMLYAGVIFTAAYSIRLLKYFLFPSEKTTKIEISNSNSLVLLILSISTIFSSLIYYYLKSLFINFGYHSLENLYHFSALSFSLIIGLIIIGITIGWNSNKIKLILPSIIIDMIQNGFYIDAIISNLIAYTTYKLSNISIRMQSGDHFWNIFLFVLSATGITSYIYFVQSGGIL